jgi:hypothetical protein
MADYNSFIVVDCKSKKIILLTSSARKALNELRLGRRIEVWNNNTKINLIYERTKNKMHEYIKLEKDYISKNRKMQKKTIS